MFGLTKISVCCSWLRYRQNVPRSASRKFLVAACDTKLNKTLKCLCESSGARASCFTLSPFLKKKMKNRCQKGGQKSYFLMKKRSLGAKGSIEKLTLVDFWGFEKTLIFRCRFGGIENRAKSSLGAPGCPPPEWKYDFRRIQGSKNQCPQAGGQLSKKYKEKTINIKKKILTRLWAVPK